MTGDLSDCSRQRNLSLEGRREARAIGRAMRRLDIRIGRVLASPFCRTRDTARLAVGKVTPTRALLSTDQLSGPAADRQRQAVRRLLATEPRPGTDTLLVSHESVIDAATGVNVEEGEALVVRPRTDGSGFKVTGRLRAADWRELR
jgi:phosphohistidine phosphatase SixA